MRNKNKANCVSLRGRTTSHHRIMEQHNTQADNIVFQEERLQTIAEKNGILSSVKLEAESMIASLAQSAELYPFVSGLGSLDTSLVSRELQNALDAFISALSRNESADASFAPENLFSYVFFLSDLKSGWKTHFGRDFPDAQTPLFTSRACTRALLPSKMLKIYSDFRLSLCRS